MGNKETLKLEHLSAYLPYELNCEIFDYKSDYVGIQYATIKGYYIFDNKPYYNFSKGRDNAGKNTTQFKPILRPLSDLTKQRIDIIYFGVIASDNDMYGSREEFEDDLIIWLCDMQHIPLCIYNFLIMNHFDVFGLIENGLAIDINTLEK